MDFCLKGIDHEGNEIEFQCTDPCTYIISITNSHATTYYEMDLEDKESLILFLNFLSDARVD